MFGDKLKTAQDRITALNLALAATGIAVVDDAAPTADAVKAHLNTLTQTAVTAATAEATTTLAAAQAQATALRTGLESFGVKLADLPALAPTALAAEGGPAAAATAIKTALETTIAARAAKQIAAAGHGAAIEVAPTGSSAAAGDAAATPANAEEFLAAFNAIKDPADRTAYFRKHEARFRVR